MSVTSKFAAAWDRRPEGPVLIAVSGGSDSLALLHLAAATGGPIRAATVDHGLRPGSGAEAAQVAAWCVPLGVAHATLPWAGWEGRGNLPAAARDARLALLGAHARATGCAAIAYGHTLDDQAETVLLRLARGSGVDGLGAMADQAPGPGVPLLRPLLDQSRAELRAYLAGLGQPWLDDPSNDDLRFDRVRARAILAALEPLGVSPTRLARTARLMRAARQTLEGRRIEDEGALVAWSPHGHADIDGPGIAALGLERRLRLVAHLLGAVAGEGLRPRLGALETLVDALGDARAGARALHGCLVRPLGGGRWRVLREPAAVAPRARLGRDGLLWDGRWQVGGPDIGAEVGALGPDGVAQVPQGGLDSVPRDVALSLPGLWAGPRLIGAPHAGYGPWTARPGPHWPQGIA